MENQAQNSDPSLAAKSDIKLEVMQFANVQIHVVKEEIREMLRSDVDAHKKDIKKQNWRAIKIFFTVLALSFGANGYAIYRGSQWLKNEVNEVLKTEVASFRAEVNQVLQTEKESIRRTVKNRLDQEFETPKIRNLIAEQAKEFTERRAQTYITENVEKTIKPLYVKMNLDLVTTKEKINKDIKSFDAYLKDTREDSVKEYRGLSAEVNTLKELNHLSSLGAQAIADGDSQAFAELIRYSIDLKRQPFNAFALAELLKVKAFYIGGTRIAGVSIFYTAPPPAKEKKDAEISTQVLIEYLRDPNWTFRAKAAQLLSDRSEKGVPEALIRSFDDRRLDVAKNALDSFKRITGFHASDVFDFTQAKEWYKKNVSEVEKKLKIPDSAK